MPIVAEDGDDYADPDDMYAALLGQDSVSVTVGDRRIQVVFADGGAGLNRMEILTWIARCAAAMAHYFGRFPVANYRLLVIAQPGHRVGHATTYGYGGAATRIRVGRLAGRAAFDEDWVLVHEMFHAALPDLPRRSLWMQEGNATWLEPVARAAIGQLAVTEVWRQAVVGMPKGKPQPGDVGADGGLDGTTAHDRLYWGGATFWLLAELEILMRSRGRYTLRDAMRGVNLSSGGNTADWAPDQFVAACDRATRTDAVSALYGRFANGPEHTDLTTLFARLGVVVRNGQIGFDDRAGLAWLRRRITAR